MSDARYHAVRKIADGGSGEVFLGEQMGAAGFKRQVVLKRIRPQLYADPKYRQELVEEAQLSMSLHHPNLVEVLDVGESAGHYFLVLELVDGWTLHHVMRRAQAANVPLPPELAVYVAIEVLRGLAYAHTRTQGGKPLNIVHRDVCPNNVLVSMHAEVKLTDFGIARAATRSHTTSVGMTKGKPSYMSPEQARANELDARSDLFSVGTLLYALLTDKLPFQGANDKETLGLVTTAEPPSPETVRPGLPAELGRLVMKALAKRREDRFASAQEMLGALEVVQRTQLKPAGRTELENFLRTLSAKDGETPISRVTMPPAVTPVEEEWISLSSSQQSTVPPKDDAPTEKGVPNFLPPIAPPPQGGGLGPVLVGVAIAIAGLAAAAWYVFAQPGPSPQPQLAAPADAGENVVVVETQRPAEGSKLGEPEDEWVSIDLAPPEEAAADAGPQAQHDASVAHRPEPPSRSGTPQLRLSARLAPNQKPGSSMAAVLFESEPPGVVIKVDKRELGKTPVTLSFKKGLTFDVWFEAKGKAPLRQWLMLTEREGKPPKVALRNPVP